MALGNRQDFAMHSGDDVDLVITVQDSNGVGVDITAATAIRWQLGRLAPGSVAPLSPGNPLISKSLGAASGILISGVSGCVVGLSGVDTDALGSEYYHELEFVLSGRRTTGLYGIADIRIDLIE